MSTLFVFFCRVAVAFVRKLVSYRCVLLKCVHDARRKWPTFIYEASVQDSRDRNVTIKQLHSCNQIPMCNTLLSYETYGCRKNKNVKIKSPKVWQVYKSVKKCIKHDRKANYNDNNNE